MVRILYVASASASSGQCARQAPLQKAELIVLRVLVGLKVGLKVIKDSGEVRCLRICPFFIVQGVESVNLCWGLEIRINGRELRQSGSKPEVSSVEK